MIDKAIKIPYLGGTIELHPSYSFIDDKGQNVITEPCIKATGLGRFPVKLTPEFLDACCEARKNRAFVAFVAELKKAESEKA